MNIPENLKYTKEHEWVLVEGNTATVGITDYAQGELGDIVFVDVDSGITDVAVGDNVGSIEAVKTVSEIYSPVSGKVIELNEELEDNFEIINEDPYGKGWILKIEMSDPTEAEKLLDSEAYKDLIGE